MLESTPSPFSPSYLSSTHNPSLMFDETHGSSSTLVTPPFVPTFECFMTKSKMLQLIIIISKLKANGNN